MNTTGAEGPADVTPAKPHKTKPRLTRDLVLLVVLGLAVYVLLPQITALQKSLAVLQRMAWWAVGLAIAAQIVSYLGSGYMLQALVGLAGDRLRLLKGTAISTAAASFGMVAGGMVGSAAATARWMRRSGVNREGAMLAGWLPSFANNLLLWVAGLVGVVHLLLVHKLTTAQIVGFSFTAVLLGLATVIVVWGVDHRRQLRARADRAGRWIARLRKQPYHPEGPQAAVQRLFDAWDALRAGGWRGPLLGAAINMLGDMLTLYFFFIAAGHPVTPGVLLAGYGLPLLLGKAAFFLPGGVGIVEATMTALYTGLGVPDSVVVVVILAYRGASFWLPTLIGFPLAARLQRQPRSLEQA